MDGELQAEAALSPLEEHIVLQPIRTPHRRLVVPLLLCVGMLVIPLVALASSGVSGGKVRVTAAAVPQASASSDPVSLAAMQPAADGGSPAAGAADAPQVDGPQVTVQAAAAADATAAPTVPPAPRVATAAVSAPQATPSTVAHPTTTSPPTTQTPPTTAAAAPRHSQSGPASYYDQAPNGTCAHPSLPFGTVVSIVDTDNGHTASCTVEDRGPYSGGRIIDLARDVFSRLAPISQGVINVRISW